MKKIDESIILECKRLYEEKNLSCAEIGRRFSIGEATVRRRLKALGVDIIRYRHAGKFEISEVIDMYNKGIQIWKIAETFKSSQETISKVLKSNGIEVVPTGKPAFNHHIFDTIDTEEKAYWLGFIFADGCIMNQREEQKNYAFELGLAIKDLEHLQKFAKFIGISENRIKIRTNRPNSLVKTLHVSCRIQFSNKHFWETLYSYGCIPNKTYHETFPNKLFRKSSILLHHFLRGFFDGDGWVYLDKRNYLIAGICGTEEYLLNVLTYLPEILHKNIVQCSNTEVIKVLKWGGTKAQTFLNYIYKDAHVYLTRKYIIAAPYISNDIRKLGNIGESPEMDNTEINLEIAKGF